MFDNLKLIGASALSISFLKHWEGKENIKLLCVHSQVETLSLNHSNSLPEWLCSQTCRR